MSAASFQHDTSVAFEHIDLRQSWPKPISNVEVNFQRPEGIEIFGENNNE